MEFVKDKEVLTICPEMMAGMGCPRTPIEIVDGVLIVEWLLYPLKETEARDLLEIVESRYKRNSMTPIP